MHAHGLTLLKIAHLYPWNFLYTRKPTNKQNKIDVFKGPKWPEKERDLGLHCHCKNPYYAHLRG